MLFININLNIILFLVYWSKYLGLVGELCQEEKELQKPEYTIL